MENDVLIEYLKDGRERLCLTYMGNHRCDGCPMDFPNMVTCPIQEAIYTLALKTIFLIWQVNELCNRLDQRLRIMMGRDDKRVWYEIDLDGGEEDEDED